MLSLIHDTSILQYFQYGYEITKRISLLTEGCCAPTEGSLYLVLKDLEKGDYVIVRSELTRGRERKIYTITKKGKNAYRIALESWTKVSKYILNIAENNHQ